MEEYQMFWKNAFDFSGRANRREFWIPTLLNFVISGILMYISETIGGIFGLIIFIPALSNAFRRLHDVNKSGGWIFINLIPIIGQIIYLVYLCSASVEEGNRYN